MAVDVNRAYDALDYGWVEVSDTWAYASATTITVPTNATTFYQKGDRVRLKQGGAYKYFYIVTVAATLLTVTGGSDYTVANAAITDIAISRSFRPFGFPSEFNYLPTWTNLTVGSATRMAVFSIQGGRVSVHIRLTLAADSVVGTQPYFDLPITPAATSVTASPLGFGRAFDGTTPRDLYADLQTAGTTRCRPRAKLITGTYLAFTNLTATIPFTWANGHILEIVAEYFY
jgi:hypothetical protein